jgi:hypothetical protein
VITRKSVAAFLAAAALCLGLAACDNSTPDNSAQQKGQAQTEQAFGQQSTAVPYPVDALKDSLERRNLKERLLRYNNPSKISYIYLLAQTGGIYSFFTIKGKVSSNSSQMTTDQLIQTKCHSSNGCNDVSVNAPGDDGSYGPNEPGIFFFTTDGVMVTWNGPYLLTDAPLKVNAQNLVLQYQDGSKPTSTGTR